MSKIKEITVRWKDNPKEYQRQYKQYVRRKHPEKALARDKKFRDKYRDRRNAYQRKYSKTRVVDPVKLEARTKLYNAVRTGVLERPEHCSKCGGENPHGHHEDHTKPLEVEWLCSVCHGEKHRPTQAIQEVKKLLEEYALQEPQDSL